MIAWMTVAASRRISAERPNFAAIEQIASHWEAIDV
jgi:hypothetical protein